MIYYLSLFVLQFFFIFHLIICNIYYWLDIRILLLIILYRYTSSNIIHCCLSWFATVSWWFLWIYHNSAYLAEYNVGQAQCGWAKEKFQNFQAISSILRLRGGCEQPKSGKGETPLLRNSGWLCLTHKLDMIGRWMSWWGGGDAFKMPSFPQNFGGDSWWQPVRWCPFLISYFALGNEQLKQLHMLHKVGKGGITIGRRSCFEWMGLTRGDQELQPGSCGVWPGRLLEVASTVSAVVRVLVLGSSHCRSNAASAKHCKASMCQWLGQSLRSLRSASQTSTELKDKN